MQPVPTRTASALPASSEIDPLQAIFKMHQDMMQVTHNDNVLNRYMQAITTLPKLYGDEGRTHINSYFRNFEAITYGWSSKRQATLLSTRLEGPARNRYEAATEEEQQSYESLKEAIILGDASTMSLRTLAQNQLMEGLKPGRNESIMDYGRRVLRVTRDSFLPNTPEEVVEDQAMGHFLKHIGDVNIMNHLAWNRNDLTYREFLDKASALRNANIAAGFGRRNNESHHQYHDTQRSQNRMGDMHRRDQSYSAPPRTGGNRATYIPRDNGQHQNSNYPKQPSPKPAQNNQANPRQARVNGVEFLDGNELEDVQPASRISRASAVTLPVKDYNGPRVVAINSLPKKGIPYVATDSNLPKAPTALSRGPTVSEYLRILGVDVECLPDPGANVSLISPWCLKSILLQNKISSADSGFHDSISSTCHAVNGSSLSFAGAITLPVEKSNGHVYVEFQVPHERPSFPIIVGTNALATLGYKLIDIVTGKDYLRIGPSPPEADSLSTISNQIQSMERTQVASLSEKAVRCRTDATDGVYLCQTIEGKGEYVASVSEGQLVVPVENYQPLSKSVMEGDAVGELEPLDEIYTDPDIIASILTDELIKEACDETSIDRLKILLEILPQPECLLSTEQRNSLAELIQEFTDVFALKSSELGRTDLVQHSIELTDQRPIRQAPRPIPFALREKVADMINDYD